MSIRSLITRSSCALALALVLPGSSARAATVWSGSLDGLQEVPVNASGATGFVTLTYDPQTLGLTVDLVWSNLTAVTAAGHIHCCTNPGTSVGVAVGFPGLPALTSGTYQATLDLGQSATYTGSFLTNFGGGTTDGARTALLAGLDAGRAYVNLHNAVFPGGEIRSDVVAVPEPATGALVAGGVAALGSLTRARRTRVGA